jgi:hypothetical protein
MTKSTIASKQLLQRSLQNLPDTYAMGEVKASIHAAIAKLDRLDVKKEKKSQIQVEKKLTPAEQWRENIAKGISGPISIEVGRNRLAAIEKMIEETTIKKEPTNDNMATILG